MKTDNTGLKILGIETSCDDTAAAIIKVKDNKIRILSNIISSQIKIHRKYGGVFPELASRAHLENIVPVVNEALDKAKTNLSKIDLLAVTTGPGLIGSLLVGVNFAKTLAYSLNKPIIGVNHIEGHIYSSFAREIRNPKSEIRIVAKGDSAAKAEYKLQITNLKFKTIFPAIALIVSGGHTSLILIKKLGSYNIIGQTRDDAAGEAFDKVAALLGLPYPGGPAIEAAASKLKSKNEKLKITLPRPMINSNNLDFSFAGLKTAVLYLLQQLPNGRNQNVRQAVAKEFQQAVVDVLVSKTIKAARKYHAKTILLGGGVASNSSLRSEFRSKIKNEKLKIKFLVPPKILCTDNAAMIAIAGYHKYSAHLKTNHFKWYNIKADANAKLESWRL